MSILPFHGSAKVKPKTGLGVVRGFPPTITLDLFAKGYVESALAEAGAETYTIANIAPVSLRRMAQDCSLFQLSNKQSLDAAYSLSYIRSDAGRDFWLTRNLRSSGYFCREQVPRATRMQLTRAAQTWPLYVLTKGPKQTLLGPE